MSPVGYPSIISTLPPLHLLPASALRVTMPAFNSTSLPTVDPINLPHTQGSSYLALTPCRAAVLIFVGWGIFKAGNGGLGSLWQTVCTMCQWPLIASPEGADMDPNSSGDVILGTEETSETLNNACMWATFFSVRYLRPQEAFLQTEMASLSAKLNDVMLKPVSSTCPRR